MTAETSWQAAGLTIELQSKVLIIKDEHNEYVQCDPTVKNINEILCALNKAMIEVQKG